MTSDCSGKNQGMPAHEVRTHTGRVALPRDPTHTQGMNRSPLELPRDPVVVYRSVNRDGATYALDARSLDRLRTLLGAALRPHPRVFIAHETKADHEGLHGNVGPLVVQLLTGVATERLEELGGVSFRDPVTEAELPQEAPTPAG